MAELIQLHQALHGYADGHQLLSSSLELSRDQQWQMLVMSDLSGATFRPGFENYLTGYPLVGGGYFGLSRTWYAPELPRPGCVWTHTIIIADSDLARIRDFRSLLTKFRRPSTIGDFGGYDSPIDFAPRTLGEYSFDKAAAQLLFGILYTSPARSLVLTSENSLCHEELAIAIFNQQWPRLRRSFSFCTGALVIRDATFDLAIAPPDSVRSDSDIRKTKIASLTSSHTLSKLAEQEWITAATEDLMTLYPQTPLREFLWKFGPDYTDGRAVFRALCEIYLAASSKTATAEQTLSAISHFFPDPDSSARLKAQFFSQGGHYGARQGGEIAVLTTLITHPGGSSVAEKIADITGRAQRLCASDVEGATRIALSASNVGGLRANRFLEGFAAGINSRTEILPKLPLSLVFELLKKRLNLATFSQIWERSNEEQLAVANFISSLQISHELVSGIMTAALKAGAWSSLASLITHFRHEGVHAVLQWIDELPDKSISLPPPILVALAEHRQLVLEVLGSKKLGVRSLHVLTLLLDPRSDGIRTLGANPWLGLVNSDIGLSTYQDEPARSKAFLLSLGLSLQNGDEVLLVREGFSHVYEAARTNVLRSAVWDYIEPYLPWYLITWDRCARLIRGVVNAFLSRNWPVSEFIATFKTAEQFRRALEEADRTYLGSDYIKSICDYVRTSGSHLDEHKHQCLKQYCDQTDTKVSS